MAQLRKDKLENSEVYHVYTRSIAKFVVFNDEIEYERILQLLDLFRYSNFTYKYSELIELSLINRTRIINKLRDENELLVDIIAYCIMPTHIHLILKQISDEGISKFMSRVLNGYSRFFNTKHRRTGPLWSGRFKNVRVANDEQLLHLTRYIHLNPTSAEVVVRPEQWEYSSYREYLGTSTSRPICNFSNLIPIDGSRYKKFVDDRKEYQQQLSQIKLLMIDDYSG